MQQTEYTAADALITARVPSGLRDAVARIADAEGVSFAAVVRRALNAEVARIAAPYMTQPAVQGGLSSEAHADGGRELEPTQ